MSVKDVGAFFKEEVRGQGNMERNRSGFTLVELMIVVIVLGILSALALPRYQGAAERARSAEGVNILQNILAAEKRWALENGNTYTNNMANLDFTSAWGNFNAPTLLTPGFGTDGTLATITRNHATLNYRLEITENTAQITCVDGVMPICARLGY